MSQNAELIALWICHDNPLDVVALADVDPGGSEAEQTLDLGLLVTGVEIDVQPVLAGLGTGCAHELQAREAGAVRRDVHQVVVLADDAVTEGVAPELRECFRIACIDDGAEPGKRNRWPPGCLGMADLCDRGSFVPGQCLLTRPCRVSGVSGAAGAKARPRKASCATSYRPSTVASTSKTCDCVGG